MISTEYFFRSMQTNEWSWKKNQHLYKFPLIHIKQLHKNLQTYSKVIEKRKIISIYMHAQHIAFYIVCVGIGKLYYNVAKVSKSLSDWIKKCYEFINWCGSVVVVFFFFFCLWPSAWNKNSMKCIDLLRTGSISGWVCSYIWLALFPVCNRIWC